MSLLIRTLLNSIWNGLFCLIKIWKGINSDYLWWSRNYSVITGQEKV